MTKPPTFLVAEDERRLDVTEVWLSPTETSDPSGPNSVPGPFPHRTPFLLQAAVLDARPRSRPTGQCSTLELHLGMNIRAWVWAQRPRSLRQVLLRKEVIQPHLPVRLPCYDFVPIADPTFDSSLSCELGHWLRVLPTFVT